MNLRHDITIEHNFETAHRLPVLTGKCQNIHGHSWRVTIFIEGDLDENGIIVDFGRVKSIIRTWIDKYLDHGAMLGWEDPMREAFIADGSKVFWFGGQGAQATYLPGYSELPWPTVEAVARMLGERLGELIAEYFPNKPFGISQIDLQETATNGAGYGNR
jgi:6-pyruvoyltetrahydropterin/6-carboxytetrahydropterin synthase